MCVLLTQQSCCRRSSTERPGCMTDLRASCVNSSQRKSLPFDAEGWLALLVELPYLGPQSASDSRARTLQAQTRTTYEVAGTVPTAGLRREISIGRHCDGAADDGRGSAGGSRVGFGSNARPSASTTRVPGAAGLARPGKTRFCFGRRAKSARFRDVILRPAESSSRWRASSRLLGCPATEGARAAGINDPYWPHQAAVRRTASSVLQSQRSGCLSCIHAPTTREMSARSSNGRQRSLDSGPKRASG